MKIFLICPVRGIFDEEKIIIERYVLDLEKAGHGVHWPLIDTDQKDPIGLRICQDNLRAIIEADEVHVWWNEKSQGSLFDLGMAFALGKKIVLVNSDSVQKTQEKSFGNVLLRITENSRPYEVARSLRQNANCQKAQIGAVVVKDGKIVSRGFNTCKPDGSSRDSPVKSCPRMSMPHGAGYEICHIVHAEVSTMLNIRSDRPSEHYALCESHLVPTKELIERIFTKEELEILSGSTIIISGHYHVCSGCAAFAKLCGIKEVIVVELFSGIMKKYYS